MSIIFIGDLMANIYSNISFGLVNIPIIENPIIKNNDTSFNQLHEKCLHRISYVKYCPHCKKNIKEKDIVKGYEYEKDKYIVFKKDELNKLKPENEKEIEIISFVQLKEIDPIYFEKSYELNFSGKGKSYFLFCEALKKTGLVALAKTVISSKFYYSILRLFENKIIMTTLFFEEEVNLNKAPILLAKSLASFSFTSSFKIRSLLFPTTAMTIKLLCLFTWIFNAFIFYFIVPIINKFFKCLTSSYVIY